MTLFTKKSKKEKASCHCGNNNACTPKEINQSTAKDMSVKILGGGCAKCNQLEAATKAALEQLNIAAAIDHVTDFAQIASYGVMTTPALVIDEKVVSYGKVLKVEEAIKILQKAKGE